MLDRSTYTAWALKMKVYMQVQGVWNAVEPNDPKKPVEEKIDKLALIMVYQAIPEDVLLSIASNETTKDAWEMIKTLCQGAEREKKARIQTLKSEFEMLSMNDSEKIEDFHIRMNSLVTKIRALGETMEGSYVINKLLRNVLPRFVRITLTLEQFGDMENMTVEEIVGSLKAHEERVKGKTEMKETQLMLTEEEWAKREGEEKKLLLTREEWLKRNNECKKSRKNKGMHEVEANMAVLDDDEPALLLAKHDKEAPELLLSEDKLLSTQLPKSGDYVGKHEALQAFKKFRTLVKNGSEIRIKVFRTDRGGEFNSNEFKEFCEGAGIEGHFTTPYTPQQNGLVERRNRTVVEMTRSSLKEIQMPTKMWA
ncbi:hypothetical protein AgCh_024380 [Apium graveolens]